MDGLMEKYILLFVLRVTLFLKNNETTLLQSNLSEGLFLYNAIKEITQMVK